MLQLRLLSFTETAHRVHRYTCRQISIHMDLKYFQVHFMGKNVKLLIFAFIYREINNRTERNWKLLWLNRHFLSYNTPCDSKSSLSFWEIWVDSVQISLRGQGIHVINESFTKPEGNGSFVGENTITPYISDYLVAVTTYMASRNLRKSKTYFSRFTLLRAVFPLMRKTWHQTGKVGL